MPLLQIAEPGMSEVPHSVHLAVGIDLGTTNSLVATVKNGEAAVLEDEKGSALLRKLRILRIFRSVCLITPAW